MNALELVRSTFPWFDQLGIQPGQLQGWLADGLNADAILDQVRQSPQYAERFPGIRRPDGTLRASESEYLATNDAYRQVMRQFGDPSYRYDAPSDFAGFWNDEVDPNELRDRFEIYDTLKRADDVRDAFYVYAGLNVSTDDLYRAVINPDVDGRRLVSQYNERVSSGQLTYDTFIQRATERSLQRVVTRLEDLQRQGVAVDEALNAVRNVDPQFARQMTDLLVHGGNPGGSDQLSLTALTRSFEYAMIGSAASAQGLSLPTGARLEEMRLAGVSRSQALEGYGEFARDQNRLSAMVNRLRGANVGFDQQDFEKAVFLNSAEESQLLDQAQRREQAYGRQSGSASLGVQNGRLVQQGLVA